MEPAGVAEIADAIGRREVSPAEVLEASLDPVRRHEPAGGGRASIQTAASFVGVVPTAWNRVSLYLNLRIRSGARRPTRGLARGKAD
jgi:hypothetical protein